jgi:hypothetical protein
MVTVKIDYKNLEKSLNEFSKALDKEVGTQIVEMAALGSQQLARLTQPYGLATKQKTILENAVYKDVHKAYSGIGKTYVDLRALDRRQAAAYIKAVKMNDLNAAEEIVERVLSNYTEVRNNDDGGYLQSLRNSRGRVDTKQPMNILDDGVIEKIKKTAVLKAGLVKAGFLKAGEIVKSKFRIPKWLRSSENIGSAKVSNSKGKTVVTLTNHVRYSSSMISPADINKAVKNAYVNQLRKMKRAIEALAKKV